MIKVNRVVNDYRSLLGDLEGLHYQAEALVLVAQSYHLSPRYAVLLLRLLIQLLVDQISQPNRLRFVHPLREHPDELVVVGTLLLVAVEDDFKVVENFFLEYALADLFIHVLEVLQ